MPELPEVETTLRGLAPYLEKQIIRTIEIRVAKLRLPTPLAKPIQGLTVLRLERRAKYILAHLSDKTTLLIHLGMSGRMTVSQNIPSPLPKHSHVIMTTPRGAITLVDPRRFGLFLQMETSKVLAHPLMAKLGPEPLGKDFSGAYLYRILKSKSTAIKPTLMDNHVVVGVGNIYASESLFRAKINPQKPAKKLTRAQCDSLVKEVKNTLNDAIVAGGSSLRDYAHGNGQLGYFQHQFRVYGRDGEPCVTCGTVIKKITQAQRTTFFCPKCQSH